MSYISPLVPHSGESRRLVILGSTGSIGVSTLKVLAEHPGKFDVLALAGARNARLLAEQATRLRPPFLAVLNDETADELRALLPGGYTPAILVGPQAYVDLATMPEADIILAAQVGAAGLPPALAAARAGKTIALANKEALVLAGHLFRTVCHETGAVILPVDSEHNALFQGMCGHNPRDIRRLVLTASGGPFRGKSLDELRSVTREQALAHPNWSMGAKISIDSATLMNKGLEVIEAYHLFGLPLESIDVVVHPQSVVHSLVEYEDRSMLAHMGPTTMMIPIAYALGWPDRLALSLEPLDLVKAGHLTFEAPALNIFPCLGYAYDALKAGPSHPVVLNAANEVAVELFLDGRIGFLDIPAIIRQALDAHRGADVQSLEAILHLDRETRAAVRSRLPA
ncbi:1-deoxy-D-xylulose-5-phosphate reductoisomerase [Desulfobaculum xiamenense]|uniref:1-deoxy-D-xylulose 5-phosphate reductoisomerase n=1 Tax=Desulfobaculum xiamenense TaxID=995050 RepID=A0A846QMA9_9BACT|nr:1-deoxy-D-xylulose-5-phosphate reductoisomerase [Desulfobaculum xiamenense]NJB67592.1 1-deoxy-D-xylulose-5-phosphate reductoisomerase [Desulfobaculum xiamenense]